MRMIAYDEETTAGSAIADRSEIAAEYRWNLDELYPSVDAWHAHKAQIAARLDDLVAYKGRLAENASTLLAALRLNFDVSKALNALHAYAFQWHDEDLRQSEPQELLQEIQYLETRFAEETAFLVPELIYADQSVLSAYREQTPELGEFRMFLDDIQRKRAHTLSEPEEKLLASASDVAGASEHVFSIFHDAEFPYPEVTLSSGDRLTLTGPNFSKHRASPIREDRQMLFREFFGAHAAFKSTLGANLLANLKADYFYAKNRKYASCLEAALDDDHIPVSVYETLIEQIHANLPSLHRFLDVQRRMLGIDTMHYYDLYASIVKDVELDYTIERAQEIILEALQPLGGDYSDTLRHAFANRWIDYMPTAGKRSGAYSNGAAYDAHPYILMNWNGTYPSLSTLAHELGHTMHSFLSNQSQPFATADYSIFVAEIASTLNENLLNDYLLATTDDGDVKLFLLGHYLEGLRGTIFRQAQFAEFEWMIHQKVEAGEPLTGESLSRMYWDLTKTYYGHDLGVCVVDEYIQYEWGYIPHFYYNFYVFQYATSLIYATALSEKIQRQEAGALERYLMLLKSGGSQYPIEQVRAAGIEPLASEAFELTMQRMNRAIDQIEALI